MKSLNNDKEKIKNDYIYEIKIKNLEITNLEEKINIIHNKSKQLEVKFDDDKTILIDEFVQ